jgi:hypothetical protein
MPTPRETTDLPATARNDADPSAIAMRVERIANILQLRGIFERQPGTPEEVLVPEFLPIEVAPQLISDTELVIVLTLGFVARAQNHTTSPAAAADASSAQDEAALEADVRMYVEASYFIQYTLATGPTPTAAELQKFALINGRLNVTPYWREFLDSSLRRAGLPSILAPVVKSPAPHRAPAATTGTLPA